MPQADIPLPAEAGNLLVRHDGAEEGEEVKPTIAVISEVWPYPERRHDYFQLAEELQPSLYSIDGFISSERLESSAEPGKYISLSFWRDEAALSAWRNLEEHRFVMAKGRGGILRDYRIRVTRVLWDYTIKDRTEAPADSRARFD